jgi:hypothetical protein
VGTPLADCVNSFALDLFQSYHRCSKSRKAGWLREDVRAEMIRLAWVLHGREMIDNACGLEHYGVQLNVTDDSVRTKMVETGAWYVRACSSGVVEQDAFQAETFLHPLYEA